MAGKMSARGKNVYTRIFNVLYKRFEGVTFTSADVKDYVHGVRRVEVNNILNKLEREGFVRRIGLKKTYDGVGRPSVVWALTEDLDGAPEQAA